MNTSSSAEHARYLFPKGYADFVQRLRVPFGFILLAAFGWFSHPSVRFMALGIPMALIGLFLRGWAGGHLAKNRKLATSGPYAYIRNPLYLGTLIVAAGLVIAAGNLWLALLFGLVFAAVYLPAVELEEQHLRTIFPEYAVYASRVNRFIPSRRFTQSSASFSWALYRRNEEYKAALGFLVALAWLAWKSARV